jgi:adenylate kinase
VSLNLLVLGPPGAGKGTQAKRIAAERGLAHIATGDMIRAAIASDGELGRTVKAIYDRGDLVSDEIMGELIRARLQEDDTREGFILDGFPRTPPQAVALDELLASLDRPLSMVLEFQLPDEVAKERIMGRAAIEGRSDDTPEVVENRIRLYKEKTLPLSEHYLAQGILVGIHAGATEGEVYREIDDSIGTLEARA